MCLAYSEFDDYNSDDLEDNVDNIYSCNSKD